MGKGSCLLGVVWLFVLFCDFSSRTGSRALRENGKFRNGDRVAGLVKLLLYFWFYSFICPVKSTFVENSDFVEPFLSGCPCDNSSSKSKSGVTENLSSCFLRVFLCEKKRVLFDDLRFVTGFKDSNWNDSIAMRVIDELSWLPWVFNQVIYGQTLSDR